MPNNIGASLSAREARSWLYNIPMNLSGLLGPILKFLPKKFPQSMKKLCSRIVKKKHTPGHGVFEDLIEELCNEIASPVYRQMLFFSFVREPLNWVEHELAKQILETEIQQGNFAAAERLARGQLFHALCSKEESIAKRKHEWFCELLYILMCLGRRDEALFLMDSRESQAFRSASSLNDMLSKDSSATARYNLARSCILTQKTLQEYDDNDATQSLDLVIGLNDPSYGQRYVTRFATLKSRRLAHQKYLAMIKGSEPGQSYYRRPKKQEEYQLFLQRLNYFGVVISSPVHTPEGILDISHKFIETEPLLAFRVREYYANCYRETFSSTTDRHRFLISGFYDPKTEQWFQNFPEAYKSVFHRSVSLTLLLYTSDREQEEIAHSLQMLKDFAYAKGQIAEIAWHYELDELNRKIMPSLRYKRNGWNER